MVATDPSLPIPRVCDADRDKVIAALQDGAAHGRLSQETFLRRVDLALQARHAPDLDGLVADLRRPPAQRRASPVTRAVSWCSAFSLQIRAAWRAPREPRLVLPRDDRARYTIGRSADCDLVLSDVTVSAHHAELHRIGQGWLLVDCGSTNGTRVNGWRVGTGSVIQPGDRLLLGRTRLRVTG